MLAARPVNVLTKVPVKLPSVVLLFAVVGLTVTDQHIPLTVMAPPPSEVIVPPVIAEAVSYTHLTLPTILRV